MSGLCLLLVITESHGVGHGRLRRNSFLAAQLCGLETPSRPLGKAETKSNANSISISLEQKHSGALRLVARR